ncbi:RNA polymerase ECF-type sigma factor [Pedobacter sp. BAL39]|uniref:RNA polymerase sigma-70 factor n=1 Tax=Pedobacter sp. BAL39 TaxID=391596 RepID=UPI000155AB57|nr:RNA polymerase sigma-70 factor [Pedobacter sp. BAL39]EDM34198.1 RNA polymerase ECF-type sigma factor [Pedobacter sp. BAL39]
MDKIRADIKTDAELLGNMAMGAASALEELMRRHEPRIFQFALKIVKSPELAQEISQDVFLKIWEKRTSLQSIESLPAWLFSLAKNQSLNSLKEIARRYANEEKYAAAQVESLDGEAEIQYNDLKKIAAGFVDQLSPQRKAIYRMKVEQGMTTTEIAAQLNLSPSTVRTQLVKSYQLLRASVSDQLCLVMLFTLFR